MTTIVATATQIAADGLVHQNGIVAALDHRKIVVDDDCIYALGGSMNMMWPLIEWVKAGADPEKVPKTADSDWGALLVIDRDRAVCFYSKAPHPDTVTFPFTLGTGREVALGAIKAGKTAAEAVAIACECDIYSGGNIQVIDIAEVLGLEQKLPLQAAE